MSAPRSVESTVGPDVSALRLRVAGQVQGVGFRPFVFRLATELNLTGSVRNLNGAVEVLAQGRTIDLERLCHELTHNMPALARARIVENRAIATFGATGFAILASARDSAASIQVPPDQAPCPACLAELTTISDRRYRYPFNNCTQCGPRYTLIDALPYDRCNTSMREFALCPECRHEYLNPRDRRFHAEPIACPVCGPQVWLDATATHAAAALMDCVNLLRSGAVVAVKGVGGYHLLCDATNPTAVARLRERKKRPHKPLAVMFTNLERIREEVSMSNEEADVLTSPARPIVLLTRKSTSRLPDNIAPGLKELGVLLPYSPLHHLLLSDFDKPVIATSGNSSGEPVAVDTHTAAAALKGVADAILHHNRPILRPADDAVVRVTLGRPRAMRLGRGLAPRELALPWALPHALLATGGHLKSTIALAWDDRVVMSPHIADMESARSEEVFAQVAEDLQWLYGVKAVEVVCDAHPGYATTRWAQRCGLPVIKVQHHHAHAAALAAEHDPHEPMTVFAWDGVGLGTDRTLWGGETFIGKPGKWHRVASLRPFRLPGGERAGRAPWRSAAALCWELGRDAPLPVDPLVHAAWEHEVNCPQTSSVGRLFDGAAALALGLRETSYEGQGPMMLEAAAVGTRVACTPLPLYQESPALARIDWGPLIEALLAQQSGNASQSAALVHETLAATIVSVACTQRDRGGPDVVGLTGGVFQNVLLTRLAAELLTDAGLRVCLAEQVPCNDGGLSFGQIIEASAQWA